ncbi:uncharacterized protein V1516DRAFT_681785 [Lipomyces oligophaga]|uniref:uncharacterized protein n=1 Tax=Lipomyces oligophaga TaxID=45792 RepID=UPI0034CE5D15
MSYFAQNPIFRLREFQFAIHCGHNCITHSSKRRMTTSIPKIPIIAALSAHPPSKTAIIHNSSGKTFEYGSLLKDIARWRAVLGKLKNGEKGKRIAIMGENSYEFVTCLLAATSLPETITVPLCPNHTAPEITYQLNDADCCAIVTTARFKEKLRPLVADREFLIHEDIVLPESPTIVDIVEDSEGVINSSGIILYTSGTSGNPKGVVIPNSTLFSQASSLIKAWKISSEDTLLHTLPLHHIHGILNGLLVPLYVGGTVLFQFPFSAAPVLSLLAHEDESAPVVTIYTAVPTVYSRLSTLYRTFSEEKRAEVTKSLSANLKLAMCGSAALPDPLRDGWSELSGGHPQLLERYGMTEVGMALSQPLEEENRKSGSVGKPLPGVHARLVDKDSQEVLYQTVGWESESWLTSTPPKEADQVQGEIELSGPTIFREYWRKAEATESAFVTDSTGAKWFKTGDIAGVDGFGRWWIKGRESMDIIKSGGEKLSALEIEREILSLAGVAECAVVGLPSEVWGQSVACVMVMSDGFEPMEFADLKAQLKLRLTGYKIPKELKVIDKIPRNQMGKVNKKTLVKQVFPEKF